MNVKGRNVAGNGKWPPPTVSEIGDISQTDINRDGTISTPVNNHSAIVPVKTPPTIATGTRSRLILVSDLVPVSEPGEYGFTNDRLNNVFKVRVGRRGRQSWRSARAANPV